jgi:hypothetical protein
MEIVEKVFKPTDAIDRKAIEEEEMIIKKLMKQYERVELQYNVNNARTELLGEYGNLSGICNLNINKASELIYSDDLG